jgi:hypothetical protein
MFEVVVEETMNCTADEFLEFVMDVHRYAEVDDKIGSIDWARREGDLTEFKFRPVLPGIPGPAPKMVMWVRKIPGKRIEMSLAPLPHNKLNHRLIKKFDSVFEVEPVADGVLVRSVNTFAIAPFARWLMEPILRGKLPNNIAAEMERARVYLGRSIAQRSGHE